ncbi:unnamed protein product [Hymenolepis diminuta]|uniref:HTH_48 domain-containing protein n=1 Tax=Hymenolepis diminuta TaxID=6216 RepID=A0A564Y7V3_HYMDI|nr:unnamed protein product [Hymenolepis diminuta]
MELMLWIKRSAEGGFLQTRNETRAECSEILNSEQLQFAIDENPTCTTRELIKTFHATHQMTYI